MIRKRNIVVSAFVFGFLLFTTSFAWSDLRSRKINIDPSGGHVDPEVEDHICGNPIGDLDSHVYNTVAIGNRCWMAQNMKTKVNADGSCINGGSAPCADVTSTDSGKPRTCFGNLESRCVLEGALYTYAGIGGTTTATPGFRGICMPGWHVPTHDEFTQMERDVCISGSCNTDFPMDTTTAGWRGTDEGTSLKVGGTSNFEAILGGRREQDGSFKYDGSVSGQPASTWFWSSQYSAPSVYRRLLDADHTGVHRDAGNWWPSNQNRAQSLRCVRDQPIDCGTMTDADGNVYKTIKIGNQCWTRENIRAKKKQDGSCINGEASPCADAAINEGAKARTCFGGVEANCTKGALYTFTGIGASTTTPGAQGICASGWHIPTPDEFTTLERAVCTSSSCESDFPYDLSTVNWRGTNEGKKLKAGGVTGFNVHFTGRRNQDLSYGFANSTWLWSSQFVSPSVHRRLFDSDHAGIHRDAGNLVANPHRAMSLRCLKN